ncbi:MAG: hypothetical protein IPP32_01175 [Bacteroidetes bacterium]|nr:hypothetical protein [Bacteroidota bacterium]
MTTQNFQNHSTLKSLNKLSIAFYASLLIMNILAQALFIRSLFAASGRMEALLLVIIAISFVMAYFLFRSYSLKAQDRAIRAEENLRHFVLCGKLLDARLKINQIVALRFAPDEEFLPLAQRAVTENLSNTDIKKAVKNWKADYHRA